MKEALVSVIVPAYNIEKYLPRCIQTIIDQTYHNLEIIIIDDGSTDRSYEVCQKFAECDERIRVITKANSGQADTRNLGIDEAHGQYIYFADGDDYLDRDLIETSVAGLENNSVDLFVFNYNHVFENGEVSREREFEEGLYDISGDSNRIKFITNIFLPYKCGFELWNRIYKAEIIKEHSIRFALVNPVIAEDACFNLCYLYYADGVRIENRYLYNYLIRSDSTMGSCKEKVRLNQMNNIARFALNYAQENSAPEIIQKDFYMIYMQLIYHELMNVNLNDIKKYTDEIKMKDFFIQQVKEGKRKLFSEIHVLGMARGIKYCLLSAYYLNNSSFLRMMINKLGK